MRYLYNTKIENISHAEEDRFIVTINSDTKKRDVALMDDLGRIFSDSFYDIEKRPYDEFYNAKLGYLKNVLIDKNGNVICKDYNQIAPFYDEISVVDFGSNRYYFITKQGDILGREFKNVIGFANGIGVVVLGNDKYCLVDKNMNIISANYDYIHPFYNRDYSWAIIKGKKVIVDRNMNIISHSYVDDQGKVRDYENIIAIDENNIVMHKREPKNDESEKIKDYDKDKCYAYISVDGKQLGSSHKHIWYFSEGIGRVEDINGTTYVNLKGEYITDKYYKNSGNFNGGFAVVGDFDKFGNHIRAYLKSDGSLLKFNTSSAYVGKYSDDVWVDYAADFSEGLASVMFGGRLRYVIDEKGNVLKGFNMLGSFHSGYAPYQTKNNKMSFIDKSLKDDFGLEFDFVGNFNGAFAIVNNNGKYDAVSTSKLMLSDISGFVSKIENNPNEIVNIPLEFCIDKKLVNKLVEFSTIIAKTANNVEFLQNIDKYLQEINKKIEKAKICYGKIYE